MRSGRARSCRPAVCLALAILATQATCGALAAAQGADVVMLANGGRLRGTVEVYEPGADLVIVLADGTRRTVPAAEVAQVIFADAAPSATPPASGTTPTAPVETSPPPPTAPAGTTSPGPAILAPMPPSPSTGPAPMVIPPSGTPADPRRGDRRGGAPSGDGYGLGDVQSLEAMGSDSAGIPEGAVREYAPDRLASSPWTDDLAREGLPLGMFHVGVELRGMFRIGPTAGRGTVPYGGIEIDVNFLLRLAPWFHLRAAAGFGLSTGEDYSRLPCSFGTCYLERGGTGLGTLGLRVLLAFDASRLFSVRIGGELGGEWIAQYAMAQFYGAPEIDFVGQLTDEGRLEIGFAVSAPYQQLCWSSASSGFGGVACYQSFSVQIEIITGVIF